MAPAQLARGRMRSKIEALEQALAGHGYDNHRLLLRLHLEHIDELNVKIGQLDDEIGWLVRPCDQAALVERL